MMVPFIKTKKQAISFFCFVVSQVLLRLLRFKQVQKVSFYALIIIPVFAFMIVGCICCPAQTIETEEDHPLRRNNQSENRRVDRRNPQVYALPQQELDGIFENSAHQIFRPRIRKLQTMEAFEYILTNWTTSVSLNQSESVK